LEVGGGKWEASLYRGLETGKACPENRGSIA